MGSDSPRSKKSIFKYRTCSMSEPLIIKRSLPHLRSILARTANVEMVQRAFRIDYVKAREIYRGCKFDGNEDDL